MIKTGKTFLNLYMFAAMINIYCGAAGIENVESISKYLLMPLLGGYIISKTRPQYKTWFFLLAGILFSWFGDIFLLYVNRNENYFLFGLASFLIAHLFYIFNFRKLRTSASENGLSKLWLFVPVIYAIGLVAWIYPNLGDMKIPVITYSIVIILMLTVAMLRKGKTNSYSYSFALFGAILFVLSDSLIAINKFGDISFPPAPILIMVTYVAAQYLIVNGSLMHVEEI